MKALVKAQKGRGFIKLQNIQIPSLGPSDVLVKIKYAAICGTDLHIYEWNQWAAEGYNVPLLLGHEFCGQVEQIGCEVDMVKVGERVSGETHIGCGCCYQCQIGRSHTCENLKLFSKLGLGCFSEYTVIPQEVVRVVPNLIPDNTAAVLEPLGVSVRAVQEAFISGESVLITGCGPIGLFAVAVAKTLGANMIIASDIFQKRMDLAKRVGADIIIDASSPSFFEQLQKITNGHGVKGLIETSGNPKAIQSALKVLRFGGRAVMVGLPAKPVELDFVKDIITREVTVTGVYGRKLNKTWFEMENLLISGKLNISPVLTHTFSLDEYDKAFNLAASRQTGKILLKC